MLWREPGSGLAILGCLLMLTDPARSQGDAKRFDLEALFSQARTSTGSQYAEARSALLVSAQKAQAKKVVAFLRAKAKADAAADERWLAKILLVRLTQQEAIETLEQEFHTKVWNIRFKSLNDWRRHAPPKLRHLHIALRSGLMTSDEYEKKKASLEATGRPHVRRIFSAMERIRISRSPLWAALIDEVMEKGFHPTAELTNPPGRTRFLISTRQVGRLPRSAGNPVPRLVSQDYAQQAIVLSGKLKLKRTSVRLLKDLKNVGNSEDVRVTSAIALGRLAYGKALPTLLELTTSKSTYPHWLRRAAFTAIGEGKFVDAIPAMEKLAAEHTEVESFNWGLIIRNTLRRIRQKTDK